MADAAPATATPADAGPASANGSASTNPAVAHARTARQRLPGPVLTAAMLGFLRLEKCALTDRRVRRPVGGAGWRVAGSGHLRSAPLLGRGRRRSGRVRSLQNGAPVPGSGDGDQRDFHMISLGSVTRPTRTGSRGFASPTYAGFALSLVRKQKLVDPQTHLRPTRVSYPYYWTNQPNATGTSNGVHAVRPSRRTRLGPPIGSSSERRVSVRVGRTCGYSWPVPRRQHLGTPGSSCRELGRRPASRGRMASACQPDSSRCVVSQLRTVTVGLMCRTTRNCSLTPDGGTVCWPQQPRGSCSSSAPPLSSALSCAGGC